jgi:hypothetical protein
MRLLFTLPFIFGALAHAQDLKTRQIAMQSLQEALSRQTQVKWVQAPTNSDVKPYSVRDTMSNVAVDAAACTVSFKIDRDSPEYRYQLALAWTLPVRDIDTIIVETLQALRERSRPKPPQASSGITTDPVVFGVQITAAPNRDFPAHRRSINSDNEVIEKDQTQSSLTIVFSEEAVARQSAAAFERVKDLCTR